MSSLRYFLALAFVTYSLAYFSKFLLNLDELTLSTLAEQFSKEQVENFINFQNKWSYLEYIITPLFLLIKVSIVAAILDIGVFFFDQEIKYKKLFKIVVQSEFIFLLVIVFKTIWFYVFQQNFTLEELQYFYPLSALNIIGQEGLQAWFVYPLQVINIFEIAYWFILAYLLGKELKQSTEKSLGIIASSYGVGLTIWVVGMMFLTLNMS